MPALNQILPSEVGAAAADAFQWWLSELRPLVPARLAAARATASCDIHAEASRTIVDRTKGGLGERLADDRPLEALDADGWAELGSLIEGARTRLVLSPPDVYVTSIALPAAARGRLRAAVALQLGQLSPLDPSLLRWNADIVSASEGKLSVVVAMARASRIEQLAALFADNGIDPPAMVVLAEGGAVTLAPSRRSGLSPQKRAWLIAVALIASIPLTTMAGASFLTSIEEGRIAALQEQVAPQEAAERAAADTERLRRALKPLFEAPPAAQAIEALALTMPETAFAREVAVGPDGTLEFAVDTADPDQLTDALLRTPLLASASALDAVPGENGRVTVRYRSALR